MKVYRLQYLYINAVDHSSVCKVLGRSLSRSLKNEKLLDPSLPSPIGFQEYIEKER